MKRYNVVFSCRKNSRGGLCVFIREDVRFEEVHNVNMKKNHLITIKLIPLKINVCAIYRSPRTSVVRFLKYLDSYLEKNSDIIVCGDMNIDLFKQKNGYTKQYLQILDSNGFKLMNTINRDSYTFIRGQHTSILDHVFTDIDIQHELEIYSITCSDHRLLKSTFSIDIPSEVSGISIRTTAYENTS